MGGDRAITRSRAATGWGRRASFIASVLGSTFWEYFVEIPEHPSLNDMIMTPSAGR